MASQFAENQSNQSLGAKVTNFPTGATRSADTGKNHYDGFLSFPAVQEFGDYMTRHRVQPDGALRDPDNWQKGIPISSYVGSLLRHALELWGLHRGYISRRLTAEYPNRDIEFLKRETACACWFNIQGFLHETLKPIALPFIGGGGLGQVGQGPVYNPKPRPDIDWSAAKKQFEDARQVKTDPGPSYYDRDRDNPFFDKGQQ